VETKSLSVDHTTLMMDRRSTTAGKVTSCCWETNSCNFCLIDVGRNHIVLLSAIKTCSKMSYSVAVNYCSSL